MNGQTPEAADDLAAKIGRLAEERGWNQHELARQAGLSRHTVREFLRQKTGRRVRNGTVSRCAQAFGLSVSDLRDQPLAELLRRINRPPTPFSPEQLYDRATQPELQAWLDRNPDRASSLSHEELDELLSLQGTGGPLTADGVEYYADQIERKRRLIQQVQVVAGTEYLEVLEKLVGALYEQVQPYRDRR